MTTTLDASTPALSVPSPSDGELDDERRDAFVGRLFQATLGALDLFTIYLGDRLGLYRALAEGGPATPAALAERTGTNARYAREWLEQQAVSGILEIEPASAAADDTARRFRLPPAYAEVLLDRDSLNYLAYVGKFAASLGGALPALQAAFRSGGGVAWPDFGPDMREAQAEQNRPIFLHLLGAEWLPAIPDVHARLQTSARGPDLLHDSPGHLPARVADVACGAGWSSIAIARAYPHVHVDGFDLDAPSIAMARANAVEMGVQDRVRFHVRDAADPELAGRYDLAIICEALHDLARPVEALRAMRSLTSERGTVLVVDERVAEAFAAPGDDLERFYYGFSVLCCLPAGMADQPSAATGTVMRPATLRHYAQEAGFRNVETLSIEHDLFRLYRLVA